VPARSTSSKVAVLGWLAQALGFFSGLCSGGRRVHGRAQRRSVAELQALVDAQLVASAGRSLRWNPASPAWPAWRRGTATVRRYRYQQYLAENFTESLRTAYRGLAGCVPPNGVFFSSRRKGPASGMSETV
jgi:hypothetical protein